MAIVENSAADGSQLEPLSDELAQLIDEHLPTVNQIVFQMAAGFPKHVDREDLIRAGAVGLVEAARRFDSSRGIPFGAYAARRIRGAVLDAARGNDWAPRSVRAQHREIRQTEQNLVAKLGRAATEAEIAAEMDIGESDLAHLRNRVHTSVLLTLDYAVPVGGGDTVALHDLLPEEDVLEPDADLERRELLAYLRDAVDVLPSRLRTVIVRSFLEGFTAREIARELGVTESRISQLRTEGLSMLREGLAAQFAGDAAHSAPGERTPRRAEYVVAISEATAWKERLRDGFHLDIVPLGA